AGNLPDLRGDEREPALFEPRDIDLNAHEIGRGELRDHASRQHAEILKSFEDAHERARIRLSNDLEAQDRKLIGRHGTRSPPENRRMHRTSGFPRKPGW